MKWDPGLNESLSLSEQLKKLWKLIETTFKIRTQYFWNPWCCSHCHREYVAGGLLNQFWVLFKIVRAWAIAAHVSFGSSAGWWVWCIVYFVGSNKSFMYFFSKRIKSFVRNRIICSQFSYKSFLCSFSKFYLIPLGNFWLLILFQNPFNRSSQKNVLTPLHLSQNRDILKNIITFQEKTIV